MLFWAKTRLILLERDREGSSSSTFSLFRLQVARSFTRTQLYIVRQTSSQVIKARAAWIQVQCGNEKKRVH